VYISIMYFPNILNIPLLLYSLTILIRHSYPSSTFSGQNNQYPVFLFSRAPELFHVRSTVSLSDGPNDVSVRRPYGFLLCIQLCCCLLFLISHFFETVREYWRNFTSYAIRFITHLIFCFADFLQYYLHYIGFM